MSEKDQVVEILKKAISPPFKATMGDGAGNVVVTGRPGFVWCRKVGRSEMLMEAYNRGAPTIEDTIVLVQQSRTEHLGYEVIGVASGASPGNIYPPLPPHAGTHEWRPGIGRDRVTVYPRAWGYLRAEPIATGSVVVWVTPGWYYYDSEYHWYAGGYSPAFGPPAGSTWYQTLYMDPSDETLHIVDGITGGYGYTTPPSPPSCMLGIAAVESTGTFGSINENMIEDIRLFMDPIEDCEVSLGVGERYCAVAWHIDGPLQTGTEVGEARLAPPGFNMLASWIYCRDPGSAGNTTVDINKNDVTVFTNQANRPILPWNDPDNRIESGALGVTTLAEGDKLSIDIDGVATGAQDLTVLLVLGITGVAVVPAHAPQHDVGGDDPLTTVPDHDHSGDAGDGGQVDGGDIINTPAGDIVATDVQAAIDELDTEKRAIADGLVFVRADKDADLDYDPLTSVNWDGDSYSTGNGTINWNTIFGVPTAAEAVVLRVTIRDSGALGRVIQFKAKATTTESSLVCRTVVGGNVFHDFQGVVAVAADGTSYYDIIASGAGTLDVWIFVVGWYV